MKVKVKVSLGSSQKEGESGLPSLAKKSQDTPSGSKGSSSPETSMVQYRQVILHSTSKTHPTKLPTKTCTNTLQRYFLKDYPADGALTEVLLLHPLQVLLFLLRLPRDLLQQVFHHLLA